MRTQQMQTFNTYKIMGLLQEKTDMETHMNNRKPSWRNLLWIIPSVIIAEAAAILRMMRGRK